MKGRGHEHRGMHNHNRGGVAVVLVMVCFTVATVITREYVHSGTRRWFTEDLPAPDVIGNWTAAQLDARLHELSRWDGFTPLQFRSFVEHQILPLGMDANNTFRFMEIGVGVGAFARHVLQMFPLATGVGVDLERDVIAIAKRVLPRERMRLYVTDMAHLFMAHEGEFNYVFVPGALCYQHSLASVHLALREFTLIVRPGGGVCASMLASATSPMGSCNTRIPKEMWNGEQLAGLKLRCLSLEDMDEWRLPHSMGRYSVCCRKGLV
jgi:SAM-dependent methyltransferase